MSQSWGDAMDMLNDSLSNLPSLRDFLPGKTLASASSTAAEPVGRHGVGVVVLCMGRMQITGYIRKY